MRTNKLRFLSFFICFAILLGMLPTVAFADGGVVFETITPAEAKGAGDSFDVSFLVTSNDGMCIANLTIDYDTGILQLNSMTKGTALAGNYTFTLAESSVLWENEDTSENNTTAGSSVFFTANFTVREGATSGDTSICLKGTENDPETDVITFEGVGVSTTFIPGAVTIAGAAPTGAAFIDGHQRYTFEQAKAATDTLTFSNANFVGWFSGLDASADGISYDSSNDHYILSLSGSAPQSYSVSECRPKYDADPMDGKEYHALWYDNLNDTVALALVTPDSLRIYTGTDAFSDAVADSAATANAADGIIKLIKPFSLIENDTTNIVSVARHFDLNGQALTGKLLFKCTENNRIDSGKGRGSLLAGSTNYIIGMINSSADRPCSLSLYDVDVSAPSGFTTRYYAFVGSSCTIPEMRRCSFSGYSSTSTTNGGFSIANGSSIGVIDSCSFSLSGTAPLFKGASNTPTVGPIDDSTFQLGTGSLCNMLKGITIGDRNTLTSSGNTAKVQFSTSATGTYFEMGDHNVVTLDCGSKAVTFINGVKQVTIGDHNTITATGTYTAGKQWLFSGFGTSNGANTGFSVTIGNDNHFSLTTGASSANYEAVFYRLASVTVGDGNTIVSNGTHTGNSVLRGVDAAVFGAENTVNTAHGLALFATYVNSNSAYSSTVCNVTFTDPTGTYQCAYTEMELPDGGGVIGSGSALDNTTVIPPEGYSAVTSNDPAAGTSTVVFAPAVAPSYTVTFDSDGGSAVLPQQVEENGLVVRPNNPTYTAHQFLGWFEDGAEESYDFSTPVTGDLTLTARWEEILYTVTWKDMDGTVLEVDENVHYNSAPEYNGATPSGKQTNNSYAFGDFIGWNTAKQTGVTTPLDLSATTVPDRDVTYWAVYEAEAQKWDETVTYTWNVDENGGTCRASRHSASSYSPDYYIYAWASTDSSNHEITSVVNSSPSCTAAGSKTYTANSFKEGTGYVNWTSRQTTTVEIPATGHNWGEWSVTTAATCTAAGVETRVCANDANHTETREIPMLAHTLTAHAAVAATCDTAGNSAYWSCDVCGRYFSDAEGTTEIEENSWVLAATGSHTAGKAVEENRVEATCTAAGSVDLVVYCTACGAEISRDTHVIPAVGHSWGETGYTWADDNSTVTATRSCAHDANHVESETVATAYEVTTAATCTTTGVGVYTASFANAAFTAKTKNVEIAALGHDWDEPTYVWAEDNSSVTAARVCKHDASHVETETKTTTYAVTIRPTVNAFGEGAYTADFTNTAFTIQTRTVPIDKLAGYTVTVGTKLSGAESAVSETLTCDYGATVTRTADPAPAGCTFLGWYQPNGKLLTSNETYSHYVTSSFAMEAWYQHNSGTVTFIALNKVVKVLSGVSEVESSDFPEDALAKDGYTFTGWDKTPEQVNTALAEGVNVTVSAIYVKTSNSFVVTIYNGNSDAPTYVECTESKDIRLIAEAVDGMNFDHWTANDVVVDYNANTWYWATGEVTLRAHYSMDAVTPQATALITSASYNANTRKAVFVAKLVVPDSGTIVKAGLVAAPAGYYTEELTADNAQFVKTSANAVGTSAPFVYTWTKTKVNVNDTWCVRAYLVYTWNGSEYTVYGDLTTLIAK